MKYNAFLISMEHPVTVKVGERELAIGNREEFLYRRLAMQVAIQCIKKAVSYNRGGHGRKRKMKSLEYYQHLEKRYVEQKLHLLQQDAGRLLRKTPGSYPTAGQPAGKGGDRKGGQFSVKELELLLPEGKDQLQGRKSWDTADRRITNKLRLPAQPPGGARMRPPTPSNRCKCSEQGFSFDQIKPKVQRLAEVDLPEKNKYE